MLNPYTTRCQSTLSYFRRQSSWSRRVWEIQGSTMPQQLMEYQSIWSQNLRRIQSEVLIKEKRGSTAQSTSLIIRKSWTLMRTKNKWTSTMFPEFLSKFTWTLTPPIPILANTASWTSMNTSSDQQSFQNLTLKKEKAAKMASETSISAISTRKIAILEILAQHTNKSLTTSI